MQNPSTLVEGKKKRSLCLYSLAFVKPRRCRDRVFTVYYFGRMLCRSGVVLALSFIKFDEAGLGDLMVASRACLRPKHPDMSLALHQGVLLLAQFSVVMFTVEEIRGRWRIQFKSLGLQPTNFLITWKGIEELMINHGRSLRNRLPNVSLCWHLVLKLCPFLASFDESVVFHYMVLIFHSFKGFSDLKQTLKDFLEDSWKTLGKSFNVFYARGLPTKSSGSLPKSSEVFCPKLWKTSQKTLGRISEDSWKILGRLMEDSRKTLKRLLEDFLGSLLMYFMLEDFPRSLEEVFCPKWSVLVVKLSSEVFFRSM
ncbi:hypothetical protein DY000_02020935 [Brassica cretica]|uniref:Uncharacterized protein n=1 Tax=Brassica cretica TaxID=69181 RepID=A0ABQ7E300_BRACR|nr:hypothetical protein DY000_02020935 [Brassica cretica]